MLRLVVRHGACTARRAMRASSLLLRVVPLFLALPACGGSAKVIDKVSGTVVDRAGAPVAGARVRVDESLATTDAAGHFTVSAVSTPYDVTLFANGILDPYTFLGLTGAEPTLAVFDRYLNPAEDGQGATLTVELPADSASHDLVSFIVDRPDDLSPIQTGVANPTPSGQTTIGLGWSGSKPTTVRIQALRQTFDASGTQHYTGYDSVLLPLAGGDTPTWTVSWKAPPFEETKLSVKVELPDGYALWQGEVGMRPENGPSGGVLTWGTTSSPDLTFVVPDLEGAVFDVTACAGNAVTTSCRTLPGLTPGAPAATLSVDEGPTLVSPGTGELVGAGSTVQWSAEGEGASLLYFHPSAGASGPWYFIGSGDDTATIPDLSELGVELPWGTDYTLEVFRNGSLETVDDLARKGPLSAPRGQASTYAYSSIVTVKAR
jgi:hypothetical protein